MKDRVTRCLVPPDNVCALAQTLDGVQRNHLTTMDTMGRKRFLQRFRIEESEARLAQLYQELLINSDTGGAP